MPDQGSRSSVRIELDTDADTGVLAPAPAAAPDRPVALILLLVTLAAGFVGLMAVSGDDAAQDPTQEVQERVPPVGDLQLSEDDRVWIGDVPLFSVVVEGIDGWYGVSGELLYTADGPTGWERVDVGEGRVLDVAASGDGVNVLVAGQRSTTGATPLRVLRSNDGQAWKVFDEDSVAATVHSGSLNGTDWSVFAGPDDRPAQDDAEVFDQVADRVWAPDGEMAQRLRLAENDRVRAHVAAPDGAFAISSTVDFFSAPSGIQLPTRLLRLTSTATVDVTPADADLDEDSMLLRSGDGTLWLVNGPRAWASTAPYDDWRLYADASGLPTAGRVRPVLNGGGVIASADEPGAGGFLVTTGDGIWQQFTFPGVSELGVLLIDDGELTVSAVVDGTRQVTIARSLDRTRRPRIVPTGIVDGEWDLPILAAGSGSSGFVGLTNINGSVGWFDSDDGLTWDETVDTDLPFGFFANRLERSFDGWIATGRLGLLEDAVFVSTDGVGWTRLKFELPRGATAVELDSVSRTATSTAVLGSLGWADDLSRTERFLLWLSADFTSTDVPIRPCPETQGICTIRSIAAVDGGLLATHLADQRYTVSKWSPSGGWEQLGIDQPLPDEPVTVDGGPFGVAYLGRERALFSGDGGVGWADLFGADEGIGPYLGVSDNGYTALAVGTDALVMRTPDDAWFYAAPGVQFGAVLAVTNEAAIVRVVTPDGPALARLDAPSAARTETSLPAEAFERTVTDPQQPNRYLTVFDERLQESSDLQSWTPIPEGVVGSGRVLDLSLTDSGVTLLLATPGSTDTGTDATWVSVSRQAGELWEWLGTALVPLEVSDGSLNGTDWVVRAGPSLRTEDLGTADQLVNDLSSWLYVGSASSSTPVRVPTGASELTVDAVSTAGGAMFLSVDLDFFVSSPPSLGLKRWEPGEGVRRIAPGGRSVTEDDHLWLSGVGEIHLARDGEIWKASAPYEELELVP